MTALESGPDAPGPLQHPTNGLKALPDAQGGDQWLLQAGGNGGTGGRRGLGACLQSNRRVLELSGVLAHLRIY